MSGERTDAGLAHDTAVERSRGFYVAPSGGPVPLADPGFRNKRRDGSITKYLTTLISEAENLLFSLSASLYRTRLTSSHSASVPEVTTLRHFINEFIIIIIVTV